MKSALLANAISSIRMGVEDFDHGEPERALSSVRNFFSGVLLLAKEVLVRAAPDADEELILAARIKMVPNGDGDIVPQPDGHQTLDFETVIKRFKDFNLQIDGKALRDLAGIRNSIEHRYTDQGDQAVREAIARAFPVVADLFRQLELSPVEELGDAWTSMLESRELFERQHFECRETLKAIKWHSDTIAQKGLICPECGSKLIEQTEPENSTQGHADMKCRACGRQSEVEKIIEASLEDALAADAYLRAKDAGEDGPVHTCPECMNEAYVDFEDCCAACGYGIGERNCYRCEAEIPISEVAYSDNPGLCGYCANVWEKMSRE